MFVFPCRSICRVFCFPICDMNFWIVDDLHSSVKSAEPHSFDKIVGQQSIEALILPMLYAWHNVCINARRVARNFNTGSAGCNRGLSEVRDKRGHHISAKIQQSISGGSGKSRVVYELFVKAKP